MTPVNHAPLTARIVVGATVSAAAVLFALGCSAKPIESQRASVSSYTRCAKVGAGAMCAFEGRRKVRYTRGRRSVSKDLLRRRPLRAGTVRLQRQGSRRHLRVRPDADQEDHERHDGRPAGQAEDEPQGSRSAAGPQGLCTHTG